MVEQTTDIDYISSVAKHPRVWKWIAEDQDKPEHYTPDVDRTVYLKVDGGYMSFRPFTRACWEVHISLLPKTGNVKGKFLDCLGWMAARGVSQFLAKIPAPNRHAIALARSVGFTDCGKVQSCCMRGGKLVDVVLMECRYG